MAAEKGIVELLDLTTNIEVSNSVIPMQFDTKPAVDFEMCDLAPDTKNGDNKGVYEHTETEDEDASDTEDEDRNRKRDGLWTLTNTIYASDSSGGLVEHSCKRNNSDLIKMRLAHEGSLWHSPVELHSEQIAHTQSVLDALRERKCYVDTSVMGSGKTYVALRVAQELNLSLVVVAPTSTIEKWKKEAHAFCVPCAIVCMNYPALRRGSLDKNGRNPFLDRTNYYKVRQSYKSLVSLGISVEEASFILSSRYSTLGETRVLRERGVMFAKYITFTPTQMLKDLVNAGVLVVIDEVHNIKNHSEQGQAGANLVQAVYDQSCSRSRVALLSATPFDKAWHVLSYVRLMGVLPRSEIVGMALQLLRKKKPKPSKDLDENIVINGPKSSVQNADNGRDSSDSQSNSTRGPKNYRPSRMLRLLHEKVVGLNKDKPNMYWMHLPSYFSDKKEAEDLVLDMFKQGIKPHYFRFMSVNASGIHAQIDIRNGYYCFKEETEEQSRQCEDELTNALIILEHVARDFLENERNPNASITTLDQANSFAMGGQNINFAAITKALVAIEKAKVPLFIRLARERLKSHPNDKVVIFLFYKKTMAMVSDALSTYHPLILDGSVSPLVSGNNEQSLRDAMIDQFNHEERHRLLIANLRTGGTGINLHDDVGNHPRYVLIIPRFEVIDLHQATGRVCRSGSLSNSVVRFVYGRDCGQETKILDSISRKSSVLAGLLDELVNQGLKFPAQHPIEVEPLQNGTVPYAFERDEVVVYDNEYVQTDTLGVARRRLASTIIDTFAGRRNRERRYRDNMYKEESSDEETRSLAKADSKSIRGKHSVPTLPKKQRPKSQKLSSTSSRSHSSNSTHTQHPSNAIGDLSPRICPTSSKNHNSNSTRTQHPSNAIDDLSPPRVRLPATNSHTPSNVLLDSSQSSQLPLNPAGLGLSLDVLQQLFNQFLSTVLGIGTSTTLSSPLHASPSSSNTVMSPHLISLSASPHNGQAKIQPISTPKGRKLFQESSHTKRHKSKSSSSTSATSSCSVQSSVLDSPINHILQAHANDKKKRKLQSNLETQSHTHAKSTNSSLCSIVIDLNQQMACEKSTSKVQQRSKKAKDKMESSRPFVSVFDLTQDMSQPKSDEDHETTESEKECCSPISKRKIDVSQSSSQNLQENYSQNSCANTSVSLSQAFQLDQDTIDLT